MSYCVNPIEDYIDDSGCGITEFEGGGKHIVFFLNELPTDPEDGTEILQMITDKKARLVTNVLAGLNAPSAQEGTAMVACAVATVSTYERELTITDGKITPENLAFWNSMNSSMGTRVAGALLYECAADRTTFIDKTIVLSGGRIFPDNNDSDKQRVEFVGKFKSKVDPMIYNTPTGVFPA